MVINQCPEADCATGSTRFSDKSTEFFLNCTVLSKIKLLNIETGINLLPFYI